MSEPLSEARLAQIYEGDAVAEIRRLRAELAAVNAAKDDIFDSFKKLSQTNEKTFQLWRAAKSEASQLKWKLVTAESKTDRLREALKRALRWCEPVMEEFGVQPDAESWREVVIYARAALAAAPAAKESAVPPDVVEAAKQIVIANSSDPVDKYLAKKMARWIINR